MTTTAAPVSATSSLTRNSASDVGMLVAARAAKQAARERAAKKAAMAWHAVSNPGHALNQSAKAALNVTAARSVAASTDGSLAAADTDPELQAARAARIAATKAEEKAEEELNREAERARDAAKEAARVEREEIRVQEALLRHKKLDVQDFNSSEATEPNASNNFSAGRHAANASHNVSLPSWSSRAANASASSAKLLVPRGAVVAAPAVMHHTRAATHKASHGATKAQTATTASVFPPSVENEDSARHPAAPMGEDILAKLASDSVAPVTTAGAPRHLPVPAQRAAKVHRAPVARQPGAVPKALAGARRTRRVKVQVAKRGKAVPAPGPAQQDDVLARLVADGPSAQLAPPVSARAPRVKTRVTEVAGQPDSRTLLSKKRAASRTNAGAQKAAPKARPNSEAGAPAPIPAAEAAALGAATSEEVRNKAAVLGEETGESMAAFTA